jgi:hypothetical protein
MAALDPEMSFSRQDKELLGLLSRIVLEHETGPLGPSNVPRGKTVLSDADAAELVQLLNLFAQSRSFIEAAWFVEGLSEGADTAELREMYLSRRAARGRSRALASTHWREFLTRLGTRQYRDFQMPGQLPFEQFLKLENRLLRSTGINPQVAEVVVRTIKKERDRISEIRAGDAPISDGTIRSSIVRLANALEDRDSRKYNREVDVRKAIGAIALISDVSVLFTTRDWSVTGTLSAMFSATLATAL